MGGERGSARVHKCVTAQCIDAGLKLGIGLVPHQYPFPKRSVKPQFCSACCWKPATAVLTFSSLDKKAADILDADGQRELVARSGSDAPKKCVQGKRGVKRELDDTDGLKFAHIKREQKEVVGSSVVPRVRPTWPQGVLIIPDDDSPPTASTIHDQQNGTEEGGVELPLASQQPTSRAPQRTGALTAERKKLLARLVELNAALSADAEMGMPDPNMEEDEEESGPEVASGGARVPWLR